MREIKFRAWDKTKKQTVYGIEETYYGLPYTEENKEINLSIYNHMSCFSSWLCGGYEVMQYTGLKDKNGVEIFEGDILQAVDLFNGVIEYHPTRAQFIGRNVGKSYKGDVFDTLYTSDGTFRHSEVIGNIYENKELLVGNQND